MQAATRRVAAVPLGRAPSIVHALLRGAGRFYHGVDHVAVLWLYLCNRAPADWRERAEPEHGGSEVLARVLGGLPLNPC